MPKELFEEVLEEVDKQWEADRYLLMASLHPPLLSMLQYTNAQQKGQTQAGAAANFGCRGSICV